MSLSPPKNDRNQSDSDSDDRIDASEWHRGSQTHGISVLSTLDDIRRYAFATFDALDTDADGFLSARELEAAVSSRKLGFRERSYIRFLLVRLAEISESVKEEVQPVEPGISRADIEEYFLSFIRPRRG